ncbi:MAG: NnrU family protein [Woeseiaceae bacterium]|nr:NnrU family protein [Woeseiaceae bacterium]
MLLLIAGVTLWSLVHLFPSLYPSARERLIARLGDGPYRGLFSLDIVIAIVLIVVGWRSADVQPVYVAPLYGSVIVTALMFVSFLLFAGASAPGNLKRWLRHPMLTGTVVWSVAHLLANGDNRSIVLFGGIGLWAIVAMLTINRRDGARQRPPPVPLSRDAMTVAGTAIIFGIVLFLHRYLFGVSALPGF